MKLDRRTAMAGLAALGLPRTALALPAGGGPANRAANATTRRLKRWLIGLARRRERRTLIGQFCGYPNPRPELLARDHPWSTYRRGYMDDIHAASGKLPALMGLDYFGNTGAIDEGPGIVTTEHSHLRTLNWNDVSGIGLHLNREAIAWWRRGGLVTINIHSYRPDTHRPDNSGGMLKFGRGGGDPRYPADPRFAPYDLARMLPGGADRTNWLAMMDAIADGLAELRDAGVSVIWRPFHEVHLGFWWGKHDPALFIAVWRDMFVHFSVKRRLDNLLWVFTGTPEYYPGRDTVDLAGIDVYDPVVPRDLLQAFCAREGLPYAITEYGFDIDADRDNSTASYDFRKLAASLKANAPEAAYALIWSDAWRLGNPRHTGLTELMNDRHFVTLDEVDFR